MTDTWSTEPGNITDREHLAVVYTTHEEMRRIFGIEGSDSVMGPVDLRVDDDGTYSAASGDELQTLWDVIEEATHELNFWLLTRYEPNILKKNTWVRRVCSYFACHFLSQRRGDPAQFQPIIDRLSVILADIFYARKDIPLAARRSDDVTPAMSNLIVSDRYSRKKLRVQTPISEGGTDGSQNPEYIHYFEF